MELLGLGAAIVLFVGFGLLIGIIFGFFGMGGSFLVTPVLLIVGYPATVAVGSGLAFVFGTSVIAALRHRAHGQIDYALATVAIVGTTVGIEAGKRIVFLLHELGSADVAVGVAYVAVLGSIGLFVLRDSRRDGTDAVPARIGTGDWIAAVPPTLTLRGGATVSTWCILTVGLGIGVLSGALGIGGGVVLLPVMVYGFGVPTAVAAGSSTLLIVVSSAFGTFVYGLANAIDVPVVAALLGGSALGARIGAGATRLANDEEVTGYFAIVLLSASVAVACKQASTIYGITTLETASVVLVVGATLLVCGAIVRSSIESIAEDRAHGAPRTR